MIFDSDFAHIPISIKKGISLPSILFEEDTGQDYSGYYRTGTRQIVVVESEYYLSTIAHELKHYVQDWYGFRPLKTVVWEIQSTYEDSIHNYFHSSWSEMDALVFEYKHAKSELNEWWLRKLVNNE